MTRTSARELAGLPLRVPFTLLTLAALALRGWHTDTVVGALPRRVLSRAGFAPDDLLAFGWHRLFSSALFTHGPLEFWVAVLMIVVVVGLIERLAGTIVAALTFWGVHLLTLIAESLFVALPLKFAGLHIGAQIASVRDVGPSAGYVGALGLLCALLPKPWRYVAAGLTLSVLVYAFFAPSEEHLGSAAVLSAGIAHLIAFPIGWSSATLWRRLRRGPLDGRRPSRAVPAATAPARAALEAPTVAGGASSTPEAADHRPALTSAIRFRARSSS